MIIDTKEKKQLSSLEKQLIKLSLEKDNIFAFPTDTVYGLGVNGLSKTAVQRLFNLKGRNEKKPLILFVSSIEQLRNYAKTFDHVLGSFLKENWPGALTIILPFHNESSLHYSLSPIDSIAIRMPNHPLLLNLIDYLPFPIVTTSANYSGEKPITTAEEIEATFSVASPFFHFVIDGGMLSGKPSTIIEYVSNTWRTIRT